MRLVIDLTDAHSVDYTPTTHPKVRRFSLCQAWAEEREHAKRAPVVDFLPVKETLFDLLILEPEWKLSDLPSKSADSESWHTALRRYSNNWADDTETTLYLMPGDPTATIIVRATDTTPEAIRKAWEASAAEGGRVELILPVLETKLHNVFGGITLDGWEHGAGCRLGKRPSLRVSSAGGRAPGASLPESD